MQHTQEKEFKNTLYLTTEEQTTIEKSLATYQLIDSNEAEREVIPFQLDWAYSVAFDDEMQFELRFGVTNEQKAFFIADWYRNGVFYQEELLTENPIGKSFRLELPIDLTTTLIYETNIAVVSSAVEKVK